MASLVDDKFVRIAQETVDKVRGLSSGGGHGGNTLLQRSATFANTRTGLAYGPISPLSGGLAGQGEMIFDRLNINTKAFGNEDEFEEGGNPYTVFNLTTVEIPDGSRLIAWRDGTAVDNDGQARAWYVGGVSGETTLAMPTGILSYLSAPMVASSGDPARNIPFQAKRTNDSSTFGFMLGAVENPVGGIYDGLLIKRDGDYIVRWGYNAEIVGVWNWSSGDDPAQGGEIDYIIAHTETAQFKLDVKAYRTPEIEVFSSDNNSGGTNRGTLVYFVNFAESKPFTGFESESFQADRVIRLRFELLNAYNKISITRPYLEITRLGPLTEVGH